MTRSRFAIAAAVIVLAYLALVAGGGIHRTKLEDGSHV